jgi:hypothetical protein
VSPFLLLGLLLLVFFFFVVVIIFVFPCWSCAATGANLRLRPSLRRRKSQLCAHSRRSQRQRRGRAAQCLCTRETTQPLGQQRWPGE